MRKNLPITNKETPVHPDQYLISRTDLKGRITYANPAFIDVSGFTRQELLGKAHNIVRHPEVPSALYQDLWDTIQAGKGWMGVVKNRRKDGGFYWVLANVAPIVQNNEITGYNSVRIMPTPEQIAEATKIYEEINQGTNRGYKIKGGQKVRAGWRKIFDILALPFAATLKAGMFRQAALFTATVAGASWYAYHGGFPPAYASLGLAAIGAATLVSLAYGWRLAQQVVNPLLQATRITRQIAAGNLSIDIDTQRPGAVGELYFSLDLMRKSLQSIAEDVHSGIEAATHTAENLEASNRNLSQRTENQAASLQSTAASMEQITVTVQQNTESAQQASKLAADSMKIAEQGGNVVNTVVTTMQGIHESAARIGDIVSLIEEIAFQTNILSLNAAVESARAGEAGRGFAIVAGEVRSLAQRTTQAAGEIKALIDASVERTAEGSRQAERAGKTMQDIVTAVKRVSDIIIDISQASSEQTRGLVQVNNAIADVDTLTQENTSLVQELGTTVTTLAQETQQLGQAIEVLDTHGNQALVNQRIAQQRRNVHQPTTRTRIKQLPPQAQTGHNTPKLL